MDKIDYIKKLEDLKQKNISKIYHRMPVILKNNELLYML